MLGRAPYFTFGHHSNLRQLAHSVTPYHAWDGCYPAGLRRQHGAHTLVEDRRGEAHSGVLREFLAAALPERSLQTIPRTLRLKAPPVWLEAEGARRSAATIGSITAAATASSSESSIRSPSPRGCKSRPSAVDSAHFKRSRDSSPSAGR